MFIPPSLGQGHEGMQGGALALAELIYGKGVGTV